MVSQFRRIEGLLLCLVVVTMAVAGCRREGPSDVASPGLQVLAVSDEYSLAVAADGTVWAWGLNDHGQLGDGTTTDHPTPVQVPGDRKSVV